MNKKRNEILSEIEKKVEKKITKQNNWKNGMIGAILFGFLTSMVTIPLCISIKGDIWITLLIVLIVSMLGALSGVFFAEDDLTDKIESSVKEQSSQLFRAMARKTEMYALSSVYSYKDLHDAYCKQKQEGTEINLSTVHSQILTRNNTVLQGAKESIIEGSGKRTICPICNETIIIKMDEIEKTCSCKGIQMYKKEKSSIC